jgi:hypothetical protein
MAIFTTLKTMLEQQLACLSINVPYSPKRLGAIPIEPKAI